MKLFRTHRDTETLDAASDVTTVEQYAIEKGITIEEATQKMIFEEWQFQGYNSTEKGVYKAK